MILKPVPFFMRFSIPGMGVEFIFHGVILRNYEFKGRLKTKEHYRILIRVVLSKFLLLFIFAPAFLNGQNFSYKFNLHFYRICPMKIQAYSFPCSMGGLKKRTL